MTYRVTVDKVRTLDLRVEAESAEEVSHKALKVVRSSPQKWGKTHLSVRGLHLEQ